MKQSQREHSVRRNSGTSSKRSKNKQQFRKLLIIFTVAAFFLGLLLGLFIGSRKDPTIDFVMSPAATEGTNVQKSEKSKKIEKELPWNLTLVNKDNPLPETFVPESLADADNGYEADSRITDALKKMIADARSTENVRIIALSAYRDYEYQKELFDDKVQRLQQEKGYSVTKAREEAATVVAYPGTSEHQLGLALDLVDARHVKLDESQENTAAYKWLYKHCAEYGFIVRYPNGKTDITGIIYEPWHFRYVGEEAAKIIMEKGITLEEYIEEYYTES